MKVKHLWTFGLLLSFSACSRELVDEKQAELKKGVVEQAEPFTVASARKQVFRWLDRVTVFGKESFAMGDSCGSNLVKPRSRCEHHVTPEVNVHVKGEKLTYLWDEARMVKRGDYIQVVEVPVDLERSIGIREDGKLTRLKVYTTLLIEKRPEKRLPLAYFMTLVPELNYVKRKGDAIHKWGRPQKGGDFTGRVFFSTLDGRFTGGLRYTNGSVTAVIEKGHSCNSPTQTRSREGHKSNCRDFSLNFSKEGDTRNDDDENEEEDGGYICPICQKYIGPNDDPCHEYEIVFCKTCSHLKEECICCELCNEYPCICFTCPGCNRDYTRCICGLCSVCNEDPCVCKCCDCDNCAPTDPECYCCPECRSEFSNGDGSESTGGGNSGGNTGGGGGSHGGGGSSTPGTFQSIQIPYSMTSYPGYVKNECNCLCVAKKIMYAILGTGANVGSSATAVQLWQDISGTLSLVGVGEDVFNILKRHIEANRPIIVGINHSEGHPGNWDKTTDHFIVVVGMGYDADKRQYYFTYIETGYGIDNRSKSCDYEANRLYYDELEETFCDEKPFDPRRVNRIYTLTQVRPNF